MALKKSANPTPKKDTGKQLSDTTKTVKPTTANTFTENTAAAVLETGNGNPSVSLGDLKNLRSKKDLSNLLVSNNANPKKLVDAIKYEEELEKL